MKKSIYLFFIIFPLVLFLGSLIRVSGQLFLFSILYNVLNFFWIATKIKKKDGITNFSRIINLLFNFSSIIFLYPDLIASDPVLFYYGDDFFVVEAFRLMIYYQFIITTILKLFEGLSFGEVNFENTLFFNREIIKPVIQLNIISLLAYLFLGYQFQNIFKGRASGLVGSFFKVSAYSGGLNSFFIVFNYFIQFTAVLGSLYALNFLLIKFLKNIKLNLVIKNISELYKILLFTITIVFYLSGFLSDVRINLLYVILPVLILFSSLINSKSSDYINNKFLLFDIQITKIALLSLVLIIFISISQIQVYRRGGIEGNFAQRQGYEFTRKQGFIQTDRNLYTVSELLKFSPSNGTEKGKITIRNIPYKFVPSLIFPNKPRMSREIHRDFENSILNNFSYEYGHTSVSFTILGELIYAYGKNFGFILAIAFTVVIIFINILILSETSKSIFYPYINVSILSIFFILTRSLTHYMVLFAPIIYSLFILIIYMKLKKNI